MWLSEARPLDRAALPTEARGPRHHARAGHADRSAPVREHEDAGARAGCPQRWRTSLPWQAAPSSLGRMDMHASWDALARQARHCGPVPAARLSDEDLDAVLSGPTLVGLPDGRASHLLHVLDGQWFTQRVRAATAGRDDLWVTSALAPLVTVLVEGPIPLRSGGELAMAAHFQQAVVRPAGWIPAVPAGGIVALRIMDRVVEARAVQQLT